MDTARVTSKLEEARFFLDHVSDADSKWFQRIPDAFVFYWSAFLNAGYSVTQLLSYEMAPTLRQRRVGGKTRKTVFSDWLDEWCEQKLSSEERPIWNFMSTQRGAEVHQEGAMTVPETHVVPVSPPPAQLAHLPFLPGLYGWAPEFSGATVWREAIIHNFPIGEERHEGLKACRCYFTLLVRLVEDARTYLGYPQTGNNVH